MDADAGRHVWGDSYDESLNGILDLQRRVVEGAMYGVVPAVTGAELRRIDARNSETLTAREMAIQALPLLQKVDSVSARKLFAIASRAMDIDPDDPLPPALAAYAQARLIVGFDVPSPAATRELTLRLADRAGILDFGDPLVVTARAAVATLLGQRDDAETLASRALAMDPASGWAWERRGFLLSRREPDMAIACFRHALQLYGPYISRENCLLGIGEAHCYAGRPEESVSWLRSALADNPGAYFVYLSLICAYTQLGDRTAARRSADDIRRSLPGLTVSFVTETLHARSSGDPGQGDNQVREAPPHIRSDYLDWLARASVPL
jgi:tetratricopeptide (TPR) repeat protein